MYVHVFNCFPDNNGAVIIAIVVVVILLILCCCVIMDILFCYCYRRKEQYDQNNGTYICIYLYYTMCIRKCICMHVQQYKLRT